MEVAAQQTRSRSKAEQRGANYMGRNRVIHHSVRHLSSRTKPQPASPDTNDVHQIGPAELKRDLGSHLETIPMVGMGRMQLWREGFSFLIICRDTERRH